MKLIGLFVPTPGEDIVDVIPDKEEPSYHNEGYEICDLRTPTNGRIIDIFI